MTVPASTPYQFGRALPPIDLRDPGAPIKIITQKVDELLERMARLEAALEVLQEAASPALDPKSAARLTRSVVGEKAIREALATGELPCRKVGHGLRCPRYVFSREAFRAWLEGRTERDGRSS